MKILLLNPPNINSRYINRDLMGGLGVNIPYREKFSEKFLSYLKAKSIRLPVMSLAYCASVLSKYHEVVVLDAANEELSLNQTSFQINKHSPDWIISMTSISALFEELKFLSDLKKDSNLTVGLIGDAATSMAKKILTNYSIDFIVRGDEPEFVFQLLGGDINYKNVKGMIYKENGSIHDQGDPGMVMDLDSLPFPKWELFPTQSYRYFPILRQLPFLPILSTRGCPYGCIYCPYTSNQGLKYRFRSPKNVVEELIYLKEKFGVHAVQFRDPTFTLKKDRTLEICNGIIKNQLNIEWGCETRVDCLDEPLIEKMVEAGLKGVNIGIESSDREVVRNVKRGWIDPKHIQRMVKFMHKAGVRISGFFIIGLPGETRKTIDNTLSFALDIPLSYAEFKIATPFPGTPLFELAKQNKWIEDVKVEDYTSYNPTMKISNELDSDYLKKVANSAYRSFYMRPKKIINEVFSDSFLLTLSKIFLI